MSIKAMIWKHLRMWLTLLLFVTLLTCLLILADVLEDSARFQQLYSPLLVFSSLGLVIIITLILLNAYDLLRQVRSGRPGARLTVRLVILFVVLAITPVLLVYYFSLEFLNQRLENWFDTQIEQSLSSALVLSRTSLDTGMREALDKTQKLSTQMVLISDELAPLELNSLREQSGAAELSLLSAGGQIIAVSSTDTASLLPSQVDPTLLLLRQQDSHVSLHPIPERGLYIQALVRYNFNASLQESGERLLTALYSVPEHISELAAEVESRANAYKQLAYLRHSLKVSFSLVLSLVMLLSIFGTTWAAFAAARLLVRPIRNLIEGTHAVAAGDYDKQLPLSTLDELGILVESFNTMTRRIRKARDEVKHSQQRADAQLAYLEIVLERMSSGVLSLDNDLQLRTSNNAAEQILGMSLVPLRGQCLLTVCADYPPLAALCQGLESHLNDEATDWQKQITLFGVNGRKVLLCRGARLPNLDGQGPGHVMVFDNITTLIQAERDAAWGEVARRLAHEIKNPLTPIRLSAERLRHKYLPTFPDKEAQTLDRMTHTIIQQVDAMKEMVDAFSNYARSPQINLRPLAFHHVVREVLDLYQTDHILIERDLEPVEVEADAGRLRQVLHNLVKNALEAGAEEPQLHVSTHYREEANLNYVELRIRDNGPGLSEEMLGKIFEPYVTTKTKGTGLGLAIVKKIVEEHGGMVWMENNLEGGACAVIRLPTPNPPALAAVPETTAESCCNSVTP